MKFLIAVLSFAFFLTPAFSTEQKVKPSPFRNLPRDPLKEVLKHLGDAERRQAARVSMSKGWKAAADVIPAAVKSLGEVKLPGEALQGIPIGDKVFYIDQKKRLAVYDTVSDGPDSSLTWHDIEGKPIDMSEFEMAELTAAGNILIFHGPPDMDRDFECQWGLIDVSSKLGVLWQGKKWASDMDYWMQSSGYLYTMIAGTFHWWDLHTLSHKSQDFEGGCWGVRYPQEGEPYFYYYWADRLERLDLTSGKLSVVRDFAERGWTFVRGNEIVRFIRAQAKPKGKGRREYDICEIYDLNSGKRCLRRLIGRDAMSHSPIGNTFFLHDRYAGKHYRLDTSPWQVQPFPNATGMVYDYSMCRVPDSRLGFFTKPSKSVPGEEQKGQTRRAVLVGTLRSSGAVREVSVELDLGFNDVEHARFDDVLMTRFYGYGDWNAVGESLAVCFDLRSGRTRKFTGDYLLLQRFPKDAGPFVFFWRKSGRSESIVSVLDTNSFEIMASMKVPFSFDTPSYRSIDGLVVGRKFYLRQREGDKMHAFELTRF